MRSTRGGAAIATGSAANGFLAYVFFAMVTRSLGAHDAAPVSVLWTYWSFAGAAMTFPLQHWIVRSIAAAHGQEGGIRRALPGAGLLVFGLATATGVVAWLGHDALFGSADLVYPLCVVGLTFGSALCGLVRGVLTARGQLAAVGVSLAAESGLRCLLAGVLIWSGNEHARWFAVLLVAGQLVCFGWHRALRLERVGEPEGWLRFVIGAAGGQVIGQTVLTGGPVVLALLGGHPAEVTGLFAALALFRLPYTLAAGAVSPVTTILTRMVVGGGQARLRQLTWGLVLVTVAGGAAAFLVTDLAGGWLLRFVFGASVRVGDLICGLTALGSTLALGSLFLSLVAMARARSALLLHAWLVGAVVAAGVLVLGPGTPITTVTVAFVAAQATAFVGLAGRQLVGHDRIRETVRA